MIALYNGSLHMCASPNKCAERCVWPSYYNRDAVQELVTCTKSANHEGPHKGRGLNWETKSGRKSVQDFPNAKPWKE